LERVLSRLGLCSRSVAGELVRAGRVRVAGRVERDPATWVDAGASIELDGRPLAGAEPLYVVLNKPKGYLTRTSRAGSRRSDAWTATRAGSCSSPTTATWPSA
jgi:23S rRNA pseudouridine2605 synthase